MRRRMQGIMGAALVAAMLSALVCLIAVSLQSNQAVMALPMPQEFVGEYSWDQENWAPLTPQSDLSATKGELYLRGHFSRAVSGGMINYYCNHIGVEIFVDGEQCAVDNIIDLQRRGWKPVRDMCGRTWKKGVLPEITPDNQVEILLYNPHSYGNRQAYREFLSTLCVTDRQSMILQENLREYGDPFRNTGSALMIAALMILGAAVFAVFMRIKMGGLWLMYGLTTLFAGACIFYDTLDICFRSELVVHNTYAWQLSAMLAVLCAGFCVHDCLTGWAKRAAGYALALSAALDSALTIYSFVGANRIFDLLPVWAGMQFALCLLLSVCCIRQLRLEKGMGRLRPVSGLVFFAAVFADLFGVGADILSRGVCAKTVYMCLFIVHVLVAGKAVVDQYMTSMRVDRMEKELEESRVAIMLSQIQPHFLYNSLSVIQELCHSEPMEAERAIGRFAEFLRGNMTALTAEKLIPFADELKHIRSYLEIEKLRFGDQLRVCYEIEEECFSLPTLTLQPLVENAVRHGVRKNENGGTVTLSVREYANRHEIVIRDDGPGFDPESFAGGDTVHVGIENVKKRLERMCGGDLQIDSAPGQGTRVVVRIPKEGKVC